MCPVNGKAEISILHSSHIFSTDLNETWNQERYPGYDPTCKIWLMWDDGKGVCIGRAFSVTFCVLSFFVFLPSPTGHTRWSITTIYGSKRVFPRQVVPIGGLDEKNDVWKSKLPKNMILEAWIGILSQICEIFESRYLESTQSINTKFRGEFQVHKWTSWVVQHYKIIVQDNGGRHLEILHKQQ